MHTPPRQSLAHTQQTAGKRLHLHAFPTRTSPRKSTREQRCVTSAHAKSLASILLSAHANSPYSFDLDESTAEIVMMEHEDLQQEAPDSTLRGDASSWKHWVSYCAYIRTSVWRPDVAELTSPRDLLAERIFMAAFIPWVWRCMVGRPGLSNRPTKQPLPSSAYNVLLGVVRKHKRHDIIPVSLATARRTMHSMLLRFVKINGPIQVQHKHAFLKSELQALMALPEGTKLGGKYTVDTTSFLGINHRALNEAWPDAAWRCDEVSGPFNLTKLSRASVRLAFPDTPLIADPTPTQLAAVTEECFVVVYPACSKPDPFGRQWGNKPMWLPVRFGRAWNAGAALVRLEQLCPCRGAVARRDTPLFQSAPGVPMTSSFLAGWLRAALTFITGSAETAQRYSPHSYRAFLATCLRACHTSHPNIQAICRWVCPESADVYAAMQPEVYAKHLDDAYVASPTAYHSRDVPDIWGHQAVEAFCKDLCVDIEYLPELEEGN